MKSKVTLINIISSLTLQVVTVISGFIIPKIILTNFGSSVNGLVSSLNQFLSYITLIEGGITGVVLANLYKPLVDHDDKKISAVLVTAKKFFNKIGYLFIAYSMGVAVVYPILSKEGFSWPFVASLTVVLSLNLLIQYLFSLSFRVLLQADKKLYVISFTQIVITVCNIVCAFLSVKIYPSIHLLKLLTGLLYIIQPLVYGYFVKKHYSIDWNTEPDDSLLKERWNGFAINCAAFIHNSTDITILTIFTSLTTVSIYGVCPYENMPKRYSSNKYTFGGYIKDEQIKFESTSGGAFSAIVDTFCDENYVIFGAESKGLLVWHSYITDKKNLAKFRKSKYSQSKMGKSYQQAKDFLNSGKKVLFSGTPCQISGLKAFLRNTNQDNLLTVEVICEGVPSPLYIRKYEQSLKKKFDALIESIDYRYKGHTFLGNHKWDFQIMRALAKNNRGGQDGTLR